MILRSLKDILYVFYPKTCVTCQKYLHTNEALICVHCRHTLPYSHYTNRKINPFESIFFGRTPIKQATSLFIFEKHGMVQTLIHNLKYKGNEDIGSFCGYLLADILIKSKKYEQLDYIVPVPLHVKKQKKRGYNQLTKFGKSLAESLDVPFRENLLIKTNSSATQTKKNRFDRWRNTKESFLLTDTNALKNKHVLLIDDVVTTGATIEACVNALLQTKNITIYVATIAHTTNF